LADRDDLASLGRRLVGNWTSQATHPALPGTVVPGTVSVEWLEGERFLIWRARSDHPDFPDSISILGDTDGLRWHYFDSRGVYRLFELTVTGAGWEIARHVPASASDFSQRLTVTFADEDNTMIGTSQLSRDNETWNDDLAITYRRVM
jgi:hypothetical protein